MNYISKKNLSLIILLLTPIIDIIYSVNYYILYINIPIHILLRGIIVIYFIFNIRNSKNIKYLIVLISILLVGIIWCKIMGYPFSYIDNISYSMKIVNLFAAAIYFYELLINREISSDEMIHYINISTIIIGASIVLSNIFQIGFKTYLDKPISGYKGLFIVHNAITAVLLIIIPINFLEWLKQKKKLALAIALINSLALLQIGTKAGTVGLICEIIFISIIILRNKYRKVELFKKKVIISIIPIVLVFITILLPVFNNFLKEQKNNYTNMGYSSFFSYVVSNRDLQIKYINKEIEDNLKINPTYFFGMGVKYANNIINEGKKEFEIIEMDFEGIKIYSGYITLIIILLFLFETIIKVIISLKHKEYLINKKIILLSILIGLTHAALGGHVMYEGITGIYLGAVIGLSKFYSKDISIILLMKSLKKS